MSEVLICNRDMKCVQRGHAALHFTYIVQHLPGLCTETLTSTNLCVLSHRRNMADAAEQEDIKGLIVR